VLSGRLTARTRRAQAKGPDHAQPATALKQRAEQRRERDREQLKHAAEQLLTSEGWQRWVRVRARNGLARYCLVI